MEFKTLLSIFLKIILLIYTLSIISCTQDTDLFFAQLDEDISENIEDDSEDDSDLQNDDDVNVDDTFSSELKAFPSAEGAGAHATGGRGGRVLHVTNLEWNNSEGSLKWALEQDYSRIIVFDVSGTIKVTNQFYELKGQRYSNMTIAGQTAPRGGITIEHNWFGFVNIDNIIVRYLRFVHVGYFSPGGIVNGTALNADITGKAIFDHISTRYSWNSVAFGSRTLTSFSKPLEGLSVQRSLFAECKTGMLLGANPSNIDEVLAGGNYSAHHNLFTHISHRFPNATGNGNFEVSNNVVYNYSSRLSTFFNNSKVNLIGNTYIKGTQFTLDIHNLIGEYINADGNNQPSIFNDGNLIIADNTTTGRSWDGFMNLWTRINGSLDQNTPADENIYRNNSPHNFAEFSQVAIQTPEEAYRDVTNNVGANAYLNANGSVGFYLDENDNEYLLDVLNRTYSSSTDGKYINKTNKNSLNYPDLPQNNRDDSYDTDKDGMPDTWEIANGFNPNIDDSAADFDGDGYTNIEEFLNMVD